MNPKKLLVLAALASFLMVSCTSKTSLATDSATTTATTSGGNVPEIEPLAGDVESSEAENEEDVLAVTDDVSGWAATYAGKLDGKVEATLSLYGLGDVVRGTMTYKKVGKPIFVCGTFLTDGTFHLREFQPDGNITGILSGTQQGQKLIGKWYPPETDKEMRLEFDVVTVQEKGTNQWPYPPKDVSGHYHFHEGEDGPIGDMGAHQSGDEVSLSFECNTNAPARNIASVDEVTTKIVDGVARYKMPEADCEFEVRFYEGFAEVEYVERRADCGFGFRATVAGTYLKLK
jgi:hypothetical protein